MSFGTFDANQFQRQLMNYTEAELIKLARSCSSAASKWLDPTRSCADRNGGEGTQLDTGELEGNTKHRTSCRTVVLDARKR
jgi:hypothetical protein